MRKGLMNQATRMHLLTTLAALLCAPLHAETIPAEDFARHGEITEVSLSPDGKRVAITAPKPGGMETQLQIVSLDGSGGAQILRFGLQNHVTHVLWTTNEQVVVSRARMEPLLARPFSLGELMSSDIRGKNQHTLFAYVRDDMTRSGRRKDQGFAAVTKVLDNEPGKVLASFTCWVCGEKPDSVIFKVDTVAGTRTEVGRVHEQADFLFDNDGVARVMEAFGDDDEPHLSYRPTASSPWIPMPKSLAGYSIDSGRFDTDNNALYALVSDAGEPSQLYRLDLTAGMRTRLVGRDDQSVSYLLYAGRNGPPFAAVHTAGKPSIKYLDPASQWAGLHAGLMKRFPGEMVNFLDFSRDSNTVLFRVESDRHPGAYYVLDRSKLQVQLVAEVQPWIKPERMAPMRPVEFKARDGSTLFGFVTAHGDGPKPMVVMPHGGPHGIYDTWGYDADAQFLASRGYAVLQVNYRGSGGRGQTFVKQGWQQWGGLIQDDIADGVHWAVEQKIADPQRICTFGASFGGYAALMNPIRNPGLYRCAVGYVGVYDLEVMQKKGDITRSEDGRRYLDRALGTDPQVLAANSPARQVGKIGIPVFLIHGKDDVRVPMAQFDALRSAFNATGTPIETLVVDQEGHGFYKPENRTELYRRLESFLSRHIGPQSH